MCITNRPIIEKLQLKFIKDLMALELSFRKGKLFYNIKRQ
jgi:hypothetical protein